jgi:hypothetical protein
MRRVKYIQEYLKDNMGIDVCVIFEPSKVRFMPGELTDEYSSIEPGSSNFDLYLRKAVELDINHINLNDYYLELKPLAEYPLYTPYGIHWSLYGMSFCVDSILAFIEGNYPPGLPGYEVDFYESERPLRTDNDIEKAMNLLFPLRSPVLAYPEYSFDTVHEGPKPDVLVIADSYYFNIFNTGIPEHLFNNQAFWYFNSVVYPDNYFGPARVDDLDIRAEIEKQDFVFLMVTERFMHRFDWKFFDMLYEIYTPSYFRWPEYDHFNDILNNEPHFRQLISDAHIAGVSLEEELWEHANFLFLTDRFREYMIRNGVARQMEIIRSDEEWFAEVKRKAAEKGIETVEMLEMDARYILEQDQPEIYRVYSILEDIESRISKDPDLTYIKDSLKKEYFLSGERAARLAAFHVYRQQEIEKIRETIRKDPEWLEHITKKAEVNDIPVRDMIDKDARFVFDENYRILLEKGRN